MVKELQFNQEYKTGPVVRYTDWHAGHFSYTIEEHVIKFVDEHQMLWYQNVLLDAGGGSHVSVFKGRYTLDKRWAMIDAVLLHENHKKVINGSFSMDPSVIILDIQSFRQDELLENKAYCFSLKGD